MLKLVNLGTLEKESNELAFVPKILSLPWRHRSKISDGFEAGSSSRRIEKMVKSLNWNKKHKHLGYDMKTLNSHLHGQL